MSDLHYYMFVDESGIASLNKKTGMFMLGTIIIEKSDFTIVEGYLRLLKRKYFGNDFKALHANELFESTQKSYPELQGTKMNSFFGDLAHFLTAVPYEARMYAVDKNRIINSLNYIPAPKRKVTGINIDMPYEIASVEAIKDFANYLKNKKQTGEIVIESRLFSDAKFVSYFDIARQEKKKGNIVDPNAKTTREYVTSLSISNKKQGNGGLEIADLCCYVEYRRLNGDPAKRLSVRMNKLEALSGVIKKHAYETDNGVKSIVINL